jgi:hypothetical protein
MPQTTGAEGSLSERLHQALLTRDLEALGSLLADDVRWGDDEHPRRCRNRSEVMATFARGMDDGVDAEITEFLPGTRGILCGLAVKWPEGAERSGDRLLYHVYLVEHDRIVEIQRYDDRGSAMEAAGIDG